MTLIDNDARHALCALDLSFAAKDLGTGGVITSVELPAGAVILGGFLMVESVFTGVGNATLKIGDAQSAERYGNNLSLTQAGKKDLTATGWLTPKAERLRLTVPTGTYSSGKARLHLWYSQTNRADYSQG